MSSESQLGGSWAETGGKERLSLVGGRHVCGCWAHPIQAGARELLRRCWHPTLNSHLYHRSGKYNTKTQVLTYDVKLLPNTTPVIWGFGLVHPTSPFACTLPPCLLFPASVPRAPVLVPHQCRLRALFPSWAL